MAALLLTRLLSTASFFFSALVPAARAAAPSLHFSAPSPLPPDKGAFVDSVVGFGDDKHALGFGSGFFATNDGGATWFIPSSLWPVGAAVFQNDTTFAILSKDGKTAHNMGGIQFAAGHGNATSVVSNASTTFAINDRGNFEARLAPNSSVRFDGIPSPGIKGFRTGGADWLRLPDGSLVASIIVQWANISGKQASIASFRSEDGGGYQWKYAGSIARGDDPRVPSNEGPNENSLALLNNGSLVCIMRLDAGDAGRYHRYASSISLDDGHSWSVAKMLNGVGAARPRLLRLGSSLLLSGGRTWKKNRDTLVWLNGAGDGVEWLPHSISYWHDALAPNGTKRFDPFGTNESDHWPRESNSYTSLVATGPASAFVTYNFAGSYGFSMPIQLVTKGGAGSNGF
eukprot:COSAG02_NODE_168_length_31711_cov_68.337973_28_plen_400_part_00